MTLIIGAIDREAKKVIIGADSCVATGNTILPPILNKKVLISPPYVFAVTGLLRLGTVLEAGDFSAHIPLVEETENLRHFMSSTFIHDLQALFEDEGLGTKPGESHAEFDGAILVAVKGSLFYIDGVYGVQEIAEYTAMGSGADFALGSLASILDAEAIKEVGLATLVLDALEATYQHHAFVRPPFLVYECDGVDVTWEEHE